MLKNVFKKVAPLFVATTMVFSMSSMAFAAPTLEDAGLYTLPLKEATEGSAKLEVTKTLVLSENANVPNVTFNFTIENGTASPKDNINAGIGFDPAKSYSVTFPKTDVAESLAIALEEGQTSVSNTFSVDFSDVQFTKPGIYRYVLKEIVPEPVPVDFVFDTITRYVDVYVENYEVENEFGLQITSVIMHKDGDASYEYGKDGVNGPRDGKNEGFENEYKTFDLDVSKTLTGNQANMNDKFLFTIKIDTSANNSSLANCEYRVTLNGTDVTKLGVADCKEDTYTIELGHEDKLVIYDLPYGTRVTITEENGKYEASYVVDGENSTGNTWSLDSLIADTSVAFTNNLEGTIPTGIFLAIGPMAVVAVIGITGMMLAKNKKEDDDE